MATLIAAGDGNWTANTTWKNAEAGSGAIQVTTSNTTSTTASYVWSSAFICTNLDVLEGVILMLNRNGLNGTVSVALSDDNGVTATREVTVNASDLPATACAVLFVFPSTLIADGGSDYKVGVKMSAGGSGATVYRNSTAGNWYRVIRTSANPAGAPSAGDNLYIAGEWAAAGTVTARTVTMDSTGSTDHGYLEIGDHGTLTFATGASTNYVLKLSGDLTVREGGTLNVGAVGSTMPSTSTGTILMDCGSNVQYGIYAFGTMTLQGASKTGWTYLAADAAINATSLTTVDPTGWVDNDAIAIASTTRTATQTEAGALNGNASSTTLTVDGFGGTGGGVAYAHSGTSPTQAEIVNLTRNVVIRGASASLQTFIYAGLGGVCDFDNAEFYWMGSATAGKLGITVFTTTGSFNMNQCSLHAMTQAIATSGASVANLSITDNVIYSIATLGINFLNALSSAFVVTGNILLASSVSVSGSAGALSDNHVAGSGGAGITASITGTMSCEDNVIHSNNAQGYYISSLGGLNTISGGSVWRNNNRGVYFAADSQNGGIVTGLTIFGNNTGNIRWVNGAFGLLLNSLTVAGDSSFSTASGIEMASNVRYPSKVDIVNCSFGVVSGIFTAHTTADINVQTGGGPMEMLIRDTLLSSGTDITGFPANADYPSRISIQRDGGVAGSHVSYYTYGTIATDSGIYKTAAPSERATPNSASYKMTSGKARKIVNNGATVTFSAWVRKSEVADGAAYNGNEPRLILKENAALGIDADTVLDTMTAAVGTWEQLTGTSASVTDDGVLEACVDCDGTAGWINVDDWT